MAQADRQRQALQTIFSFFLGLMVLALIGIAVYTVYPNPQQQGQEQIDKLYRDMEMYNSSGKTPSELSPSDTAKRDALQKQIDDLQKKQREVMEGWARNTSIALIVLATIVMSVSLIRSEQLRVLSNGLLLGGVFTMLYGVGWSIASGESWTRLIVVFFATAVTIALGYVKFVRSKQAAAAGSAGGGQGTAVVTEAEVDDLEARVASVEAKLAAIGEALAGPAREPRE